MICVYAKMLHLAFVTAISLLGSTHIAEIPQMNADINPDILACH